MATQVLGVSVMTHPHYMAGYSSKARLPDESKLIEKLPSRVHKLARGNQAALDQLRFMYSLHQHYRKTVDETKARRGAHMIMLTSERELIDDTHDMHDLHLAKIPKDIAKAVLEYGKTLQGELVSYAAGRLGKRFGAFEASWEPEVAGRALKAYLRRNSLELHPNAEISVFGEYLGEEECVNDAHKSILAAGFANAKIEAGKSIKSTP